MSAPKKERVVKPEHTIDLFRQAYECPDPEKKRRLNIQANLMMELAQYNVKHGYAPMVRPPGKVGRPGGSQKLAGQVSAAVGWVEQNVPNWRDQKPYTIAGLAHDAGYAAGKSAEASIRNIAEALKAKK